jgi:hypothetical protein
MESLIAFRYSRFHNFNNKIPMIIPSNHDCEVGASASIAPLQKCTEATKKCLKLITIPFKLSRMNKLWLDAQAVVLCNGWLTVILTWFSFRDSISSFNHFQHLYKNRTRFVPGHTDRTGHLSSTLLASAPLANRKLSRCWSSPPNCWIANLKMLRCWILHFLGRNLLPTGHMNHYWEWRVKHESNKQSKIWTLHLRRGAESCWSHPGYCHEYHKY